MSRDYILGLATLPAITMAAGLTWLARHAIPALARRWAPAHWSLRGPQRRHRRAADLFLTVNAGSRHMTTFRRLLAVGPWTLYAARYAPGHVAEHDHREATP